MIRKIMLSKNEVEHIAKLANLSLNQEEIEKFQKQLGDVLDYISVLDELDTKAIKPTSQVTGLKNVFRKDEIGKCLSQAQALSGTKSKHKGYFKTKSIFK